LLDLRDHFEAGKERGREKRREKKRKETEGKQTPSRNKFLVTALNIAYICSPPIVLIICIKAPLSPLSF